MDLESGVEVNQETEVQESEQVTTLEESVATTIVSCSSKLNLEKKNLKN